MDKVVTCERALKYVKQLQDTLNEARATMNEYNVLRSNLDREISGIYHEIENTRMNVVTGYKLAKRLQDVLMRRRAIKIEYETLTALCKRLENINLERELHITLGDVKRRQHENLAYQDGLKTHPSGLAIGK